MEQYEEEERCKTCKHYVLIAENYFCKLHGFGQTCNEWGSKVEYTVANKDW